MSPPLPSSPASDHPAASSTEPLPPDPAAAATPGPPARDIGTGTVPQADLPPAAPDRTEFQAPEDRKQSADLGATVVQRLSDRLASESISRRMQAAGYQLIKPLGEGTYGAVWLAEEQSTGVRVAIKFFAHGAGRRWEMLQEEVKQLAALDAAQGIVHLKDAVAEADPPYYVMSYVEGGSLAQRLEKGPLTVPEALAVFQEVVQAMAYVHAHGIRHCDLKPGNILLDRLGKPLVADFGQAHLSNDATPALGTFFYMAPEQANLADQIPDTRWDVYGLGALMYAMLTGEPPRKDSALSGELKNTLELSHRLRRYREGVAGTPKPTAHRQVPGVDRRLARIIDACLELDPKKRLSSAAAILDELRRRRVRMRQRPLMMVGMLAPLLILLLTSMAGYALFRSELASSEATLVHQTLEGDKVTAQLAANGLNQGLPKRISLLQGLLRGKTGDDLRQQLKKPRGPGAGDEEVRKVVERMTGNERMTTSQSFSGLRVVYRDGYIRWDTFKDDNGDWRVPPDRDSLWAGNWKWRDWFNGRGDLDPEAHPDPDPVSTPHISQPYRPTGQGRGERLIDVSVPIRDEQSGRILGLLVGSLTWKDFNTWLEKTDVPNGQLIVFNDHGQPLRHNSGATADAPAPEVVSPDCAARLAAQLTTRDKPDAVDSFNDPFPGGKTGQLAGYSLFDPNPSEPNRDGPLAGRWGVIVEQDRDEVLAPVARLRERLSFAGVSILVVAGVLTGGVWWCLIWLLRRQERLGHG